MKGIVWKLSLFLTLSLALSLAFSFLLSGKVNAASDFDNAIETTTTLRVSNPGVENFVINNEWRLPASSGYQKMIDNEINYASGDYTGINLSWSQQVSENRNVVKAFYENNKQYIVLQQCDDVNGCSIQVLFGDDFTTFTMERYSSPGLGMSTFLRVTGNYLYYTCAGPINRGSSGSPDATKSYISNCFSNYNSFGSSFDLFLAQDVPDSGRNAKVYETFNLNIIYPPGYEGKEIGNINPNDVQRLKPEFQWSGTKEGLLNVQYLKNITPFLSGSFAVVINKMSDNWDDLEEEVHNEWYSPAGWLNENIQLPEAGYYMMRIDYNQSFQSPPWQEPYPIIESVYIQFRWDGTNVIPHGTNVICEAGVICNTEKEETKEENKWWKLFNSLDAVNTYGLTAFLLAPINFLATLPAKVNNCQPVNLPLLNDNISLECLKQRYFNWSPFVMNIYTVMINALVAFGVAFLVFKQIKDINTPQKDSIEVVKL